MGSKRNVSLFQCSNLYVLKLYETLLLLEMLYAFMLFLFVFSCVYCGLSIRHPAMLLLADSFALLAQASSGSTRLLFSTWNGGFMDAVKGRAEVAGTSRCFLQCMRTHFHCYSLVYCLRPSTKRPLVRERPHDDNACSQHGHWERSTY